MSAYIIAFLEVSDKDRYAEYTKVTPGIIAQYGGKFIARGGKTETLEGPRGERRVVLLEFPSYEKALAFYQSEEYQQAKAIRTAAAEATLVIVDGWTPATSD